MSIQLVQCTWNQSCLPQYFFQFSWPSVAFVIDCFVKLEWLSGSLSASLSLLKTYFYSWGLRTGSATEWSLPWVALYKFRNTIRTVTQLYEYSSNLFSFSNNVPFYETVLVLVTVSRLGIAYVVPSNCPVSSWKYSSLMQILFPLATNVPSNFFKICVQIMFLLCNILPELIWIWNYVHEICAKHSFRGNIYVRFKFSCVRSSHNLCAHAYSLEGTLLATGSNYQQFFGWKRIFSNVQLHLLVVQFQIIFSQISSCLLHLHFRGQIRFCRFQWDPPSFFLFSG